MKAGELRELSVSETERKRDELRQAFFNLSFQLGIGQLENTAKLKQTRREIARVETIIREKKKAQKGGME